MKKINMRFISYTLLIIIAIIYCTFKGNTLNWPDENTYVGIATRLNNGYGFSNESSQPSAFRPPVYPYIVSIILKINNSFLAAKLMNVFFLFITVIYLEKIINFVSPYGGKYCPLLALFYPLLIYASGILVPQIFGSMLFIISIYYLIIKNDNFKNAAICGISIGILLLTIPTFILIYILFTLLLLKNINLKFKYYICVALISIITISPWIIRNSILYNRFIFISTNSGINLLYSNSDNTKYNTGTVDIYKYAPKENLNEAQEDAHYKKVVYEWVTEDPKRFLILYLQKTLNYFNFTNNISNKAQDSILNDILLFLTYYPLLLISFIRLLFSSKVKLSFIEKFLFITYFGNSLLSAIFFTRIRYRIPFDFLLIAICCIAIGHYLENKKLRKLTY